MSGDAARAHSLIAVGRFEEAAIAVARAAAAEPESAEPLCLLAQALLAEGRDAEGLDAAGRRVALDPEDEWALRLLSAACLRLHRESEALDAAWAAVRIEPDSGYTLAGLARAQVACGRHEEAEETAARLVERAPEWEGAHEVAGHVAIARGDNRTAEGRYRAALAIDPHDVVVVNNLGVALQRRRRHAEAMAQFEAAARLDPARPGAHTNLQRATLRRMLVGGGVGVWLLFRVAVAALKDMPETAVGVVVAGAVTFALVGVAVWRRRRLSEVARTYVDAELRRGRVALKVAGGVAVVAALAALSTVRGMAWAAPLAELVVIGAFFRYVLWPMLRHVDDPGRRVQKRTWLATVVVAGLAAQAFAALFGVVPHS